MLVANLTTLVLPYFCGKKIDYLVRICTCRRTIDHRCQVVMFVHEQGRQPGRSPWMDGSEDLGVAGSGAAAGSSTMNGLRNGWLGKEHSSKTEQLLIYTGDIVVTCFTIYVPIYSKHNINTSTVATSNSYKHEKFQSSRMNRTSYIYCNCEVI